MYLVHSLGALHDQERSLLIQQAEVVPHMLPHSAKLGDAVASNREILRYDGTMNGCLSLWLGQECHAEGPKVGPEQEVEGVDGVRPSCSMLHVVLAAKQPIR